MSNSLETVSSSSGGGVQLAVCTRPATAEESPVRGTQPYGLVSHLQQTHSSVTRGDYPRPSTGESRKGAFRFFSTWRATVGQPKEGLQKPRRSAPEADPSRGGYGCKAPNMGRPERQPLRGASHCFRSHKTKPLLDKPGHQRPRDQADRANASKTAHRQQRPSGNNQKSPTPT